MAQELEKTGPAGAIARSADVRGTEHLTQEDIQMPRLAIAQGLSPELQENNAKYIPELKLGQMFNNLTGDIYGKGPIEFVIVRADRPRYIEFIPREQGGGIADMDVAPDDERTRFRKDADGKTLPPIATKFYDYVIMMLPSMEPIALSMKGKSLKAAKSLNALIKLRNKPIFEGKYKVSAVSETNAKGTYGVYQVRNSGEPDKETKEQAEMMFNMLRGKNIQFEREPGDDDADDFPPVPGAATTRDDM
jgi:hypothetical protein